MISRRVQFILHQVSHDDINTVRLFSVEGLEAGIPRHDALVVAERDVGAEGVGQETLLFGLVVLTPGLRFLDVRSADLGTLARFETACCVEEARK